MRFLNQRPTVHGAATLTDESDVEFARSESFDSDYEVLEERMWDSGKEGRERASSGHVLGTQPQALSGSAGGHVFVQFCSPTTSAVLLSHWKSDPEQRTMRTGPRIRRIHLAQEAGLRSLNRHFG